MSLQCGDKILVHHEAHFALRTDGGEYLQRKPYTGGWHHRRLSHWGPGMPGGVPLIEGDGSLPWYRPSPMRAEWPLTQGREETPMGETLAPSHYATFTREFAVKAEGEVPGEIPGPLLSP